VPHSIRSRLRPGLRGLGQRLLPRYASFGPIVLFAGLEPVQSINTPERFLIGGGLACLALAAGALLKRRQNSLALGADIFLLLGAAAWIVQLKPLMDAFQALRETALFMTMLAIGAFRTLLAPQGFIDAPIAGPGKVRARSWLLLAGVAGAAIHSAVFPGREWLSAGLPFLGLLLVQSRLAKAENRGQKAEGRNQEMEDRREKPIGSPGDHGLEE